MILDGKKIAWTLYDEIEAEIQWLDTNPKLGVILVWNNPASLKYIEQKKSAAKKVWIDFELFQFEEFVIEEKLLEKINELNTNPDISWYIIQLPLPNHISKETILRAVSPKKDIDGFHPENQGALLIGDTKAFIPCTPAGIMELFTKEKIELTGKNICVIGRSNIVWKPMLMLLINAGATVSSCNSHTKDLKKYTKNADIIISATGQKWLISQEHVQNDKTVIIDVGFNYDQTGISGDCDFETLHKNWNLITPVPGWVWPMTVAMLMKNTLKAYHLNTK